MFPCLSVMDVGTLSDGVFLATRSSQLARKRLPPVAVEPEFTRRAEVLREIYLKK